MVLFLPFFFFLVVAVSQSSVAEIKGTPPCMSAETCPQNKACCDHAVTTNRTVFNRKKKSFSCFASVIPFVLRKVCPFFKIVMPHIWPIIFLLMITEETLYFYFKSLIFADV